MRNVRVEEVGWAMVHVDLCLVEGWNVVSALRAGETYWRCKVIKVWMYLVFCG